jgi:hypothetical protein
MDSARPGSPNNLLTLQEAAQYIAVSVDALISLNEHDILKPTINTNGEIAYTKNQLDKFLSLKSFSKTISHEIPRPATQSNSSDNLSLSPTPVKESGQQNNFAQINNYHFHNYEKKLDEEIKATISIKKLGLTLSFFAIALLALTLLQHSRFNSLLQQPTINGIEYDSQSATIETTTNKNVKNTIVNEKEKIVSDSENLDKAFETNRGEQSLTENNSDKLSILKSILGSESENVNNGSDTVNEVVTYGQKSDLRSSNSLSNSNDKNDIENQVFDTEGNIKVSNESPTEKELLATALGAPGVNQSQDLVRQNSGTAGVITFTILGLVFIYFLYSSKRHTILASGNYNDLSIAPSNTPLSFNVKNDLEWEKILEVSQKTDGSVVIIFRDKEYRVSKPELDSESDKFIERLMQLSNNGQKEIEYDCISDQEIIFHSPLSKLVTRLGFVGLKRDLFFPRTSKSRVLFRKFLTLDDLFSMNLTIEDLSERIDQIN